MKIKFTAVAFFCVVSTAFAQEIDKQVTDWSVFGDQQRFDIHNPGMLSGYSLSTAAELGISEGWNETATNRAEKVTLQPNRRVLNFGEYYYLDDCMWLIGGKWVPFKNRFRPIKEVPPPSIQVPPPPPIVQPPELTLPPPPPEITLLTPPPPLELRYEEYRIYYIELSNGHKFPIPCIPREKGWFGVGLPIVECAALGFGAYEVFGAFEGGAALVKVAAPVFSAAP